MKNTFNRFNTAEVNLKTQQQTLQNEKQKWKNKTNKKKLGDKNPPKSKKLKWVVGQLHLVHVKLRSLKETGEKGREKYTWRMNQLKFF